MKYTKEFLNDSIQIVQRISLEEVEAVARLLATVKSEGGRIFFAGSGGGAGHSSHAAADFRKIAEIECYSVTDNVSELTARINDEAWATSYSKWLKGSRLRNSDCLFIFSVGGGDKEKKISENLVDCIDYARNVGAKVSGIVGRDVGHLRKNADASILIPNVNPKNLTTQAEGFQALIWHLLVCHPLLRPNLTKWESESEQKSVSRKTD